MVNKKSPILVTGAGIYWIRISKGTFIKRRNVIGIDNLNDYYDINLKYSRIEQINKIANAKNCLEIYKLSIEDFSKLKEVFDLYQPKIVVNLAAQAGVRYSLKPKSYIDSNLIGFFNILENYEIIKLKT